MSIQDVYGEFFKVKENPKRLVAKLYNACEDGKIRFNQSVIIPTSYYPLNNSDFHIFNSTNCKKCEDKNILKCFDETTYEAGHCYQMADELKERLVKCGCDAKVYVGWLFTQPTETPLHHAWVVVDDYVLDLQDDWTAIYSNQEKFEGKSIDECRQLLAEFHVYCYKNRVPNSIRCAPVGVPHQTLYYIGCEVECGKVGRKEYNRLVDEYPNHDCTKRIADKSGATKSQLLLKKMLGGN